MRRILATTVLAASALLLSGCVIMPELGGGSPAPSATVEAPRPSASGAPDASDDCTGGTLTLNTPGNHVVGDCERLTIEGAGVKVKAGEIGTLIVRGTDNDAEAESIGRIEISGQNNDAESAAAVGSIAIAGDDNDIEVIGDIGAVVIAGNENDISAAGRIGSVADNGSNNKVVGAQP